MTRIRRACCVIRPRRRAVRGVENPEDPHFSWARVLDAMDLTRREMETGTRPKRKLVAVDIGDSMAFKDIADLVVRVAVERSLRRIDDPDELCDLHAPGVLVDQVAEAPFR